MEAECSEAVSLPRAVEATESLSLCMNILKIRVFLQMDKYLPNIFSQRELRLGLPGVVLKFLKYAVLAV